MKNDAQRNTTMPSPRMDQPDWMSTGWMQIHEDLVRRTEDMPDARLLFVGDSITRQWEDTGREAWNRHFASAPALNLGIGGDRTEHVLWRLANNPYLPALKPDAAVLLIGTNNLGWDEPIHTPEDVAAGVIACTQTLRRLLSETPVIALAILPRAFEPDSRARQTVDEANALLAATDFEQGIRYLDIGKVFLEPDGAISPETMPDALHLSPEAYERFAQALLPFCPITADTPS